MKDLIQIIIPVYNVEKYLERCLNSILNQSYKEYEVILIDDGSSDSSGDICDNWHEKDSRFTVIHQENKGAAEARKSGIKKAFQSESSYLAFIDSDDYVEKDYLLKLYERIKKENAEISECSANILDETDNLIGTIAIRDPEVLEKEGLEIGYAAKEYSSDFLWNKLYRKELFRDLKIADYKCSEDYYINTLLYEKINKKVTIQDCLYNYIRREGSLGSETMNDKKLDNIRAREAIFEHFNENGKKQLSYLTAYQILNQVIVLNGEIKNMSSERSSKYKEIFDKTYQKYFKYAIKAKFKKSNMKRKLKLYLYRRSF